MTMALWSLSLPNLGLSKVHIFSSLGAIMLTFMILAAIIFSVLSDKSVNELCIDSLDITLAYVTILGTSIICAHTANLAFLAGIFNFHIEYHMRLYDLISVRWLGAVLSDTNHY